VNPTSSMANSTHKEDFMQELLVDFITSLDGYGSW
jgi:hypothetical protein